ncbi:MAG: hypothetical protein V4724_24040 [Pseudomonadota bacterium]
MKTVDMLRHTFAGPALVLIIGLPAWAQTGQALIGNPLLSPAKVKEVKRQIADAAHRSAEGPPPESMPPPVQMPMPASMRAAPSFAPDGMMGGGGRPAGEAAKQALARLRVMAIVGNSALLAIPAMGESSPMPAPMQMQMPPMQMSGMQMPSMPMSGMQSGIAAQPLPQGNQNARRSSSTMVRDREAAYVEGFDVVAIVKGDSVRLVLASAPNATIFFGTVQPSLHSPSSVVAPTALEKPSAEYTQLASPDAASMTSSSAYPAQSQSPGQSAAQPYRSRPPSNGDGFQQF